MHFPLHVQESDNHVSGCLMAGIGNLDLCLKFYLEQGRQTRLLMLAFRCPGGGSTECFKKSFQHQHIFQLVLQLYVSRIHEVLRVVKVQEVRTRDMCTDGRAERDGPDGTDGRARRDGWTGQT